MKRILLITFLTLFMIFTFNSLNDEDNRNSFFLKPLKGKIKVYLHLIKRSDLKVNSTIKKGDIIGNIEPFPNNYSNKNDSIIKDSLNYYNKKDYENSFKLLNQIKEEESENLFFLYFYAKTLFWSNDNKIRKSSFENFKKMEDIINKNNKIDLNSVAIDLWFSEIYWKLGCLYLDYKDYDNAILEITKYLYSNPNLEKENNSLYEQVLCFINEAYYYKKDYEMNNFFYNEIKRKYPNNKYVEKYKIKK